MKKRRIVLIAGASLVAVAAFLLLVTTLALAHPILDEQPAPAAQQPLAPQQEISVTFPMGNWPWYAQEEITVHPEPPIPGRPVELCAEVVNEDFLNPHIAILEFSVANFGIGVPFTWVGMTEVEVPPGGSARGCVVWVPRKPGHWCIEALLSQPDVVETLRSQRNIDIWEPLVPGQPDDLVFPVGPHPEGGEVLFDIQNVLPGWDVILEPPQLILAPNEAQSVTLHTTPPPDAVLGSRMPVADIEGFIQGVSIGGFRKLDMPPVLLHRLKDPFFAESEISIWPYPPRIGEPTQICVELFNVSDVTQTVEVLFNWANFGMGLPFNPINGPILVEIPPHSHKNVCVWWVPPFAGHFCVQVEMHILGAIPYEPQFSQRNLDVNEPLRPGVPHETVFHVGNAFNPFTNPDPVEKDIWLELDFHSSGWMVQLDPSVLPAMQPEEIREVKMTVTPSADWVPGDDGMPILDVRAMHEVQGVPQVLGGFRKIYRPPVPLHRFPDPPYAEREISIHPYPPLAGEPTEVCVELYNPTPFPQEVTVHFAWANFGIGIPFTPINGPRTVVIPPFTTIKECIHWIPPTSGHVCIEVVLEMEGYPPQHSQRNIDVDEPLVPGEPHTLPFPVQNPFDQPVDIELGLIPHLPGWEFELSETLLPQVEVGAERIVNLTVVPPAGVPLPHDGEPIVDVEAYVDGELIGGFRKIHRPPVPLHPFPDPPYAEREISVHPYPPLAGEPTEVCVELYNPTPFVQEVKVQFSWANFGIGLPFQPIHEPQVVFLPPYSTVKKCIHWVPPTSGHVCLQVELWMEGYPPQRSQRNVDVDEPLLPGEPHTLPFVVGNPTQKTVSMTLGLIPHVDGWGFMLEPDTLPDMAPDAKRVVSLTVIPPAEQSVFLPPDEPLPIDGLPIADVEAYIEGELIGGFRKILRPPIQLHPYPDPPYAEREITVEPYPPRVGEPVEICVELRNPTPYPHDVVVHFSWANFGIGLPFQPINGPRHVHLPPFSTVKECIHWIPPIGGHMCLQVMLEVPGYPPQYSQRNLDVDEPLEPLIPHELLFPVGNPLDEVATIQLGLVPHLDRWGVYLSEDELLDMQPGEIREVVLTVIPPEDLPPDGTPIVDVEAFIEGRLIGGFRKIFRPPVPIHRPRDPIYAESEIFIHPYPPREREPTEVGVEIRNPTGAPQTVIVHFSAANFGIGLPFMPIHEPVEIVVPPHSLAHPHIMWVPPRGGLWCIQVEVEIPNLEMFFYSQRNIDVGEPLEPLIPHARPFLVGNPLQHPATVTLGLVPHFPDWGLELSEDVLVNMQPGEVREVVLTVTPPADLPADGDPIVDVEAFVAGELIGGFRKIFRPPVPVHRPRDPVYAESEIGVDPYPILPGVPTHLSVEVFNPTDKDRVVTVTFSVAHFGIGLPFSTSHIIPNPVAVFVPKFGAARAHTIWFPPPTMWGKFCVRVTLEMEGHEPIWSQRNIDVGEPLMPGEPHDLVFPVGVWPHTETMSVTLGLVKHRDWDISLSDTEILVTPGQPVNVTLTVTPTADAKLGTGDPIVDVEGYVEGELIGGFRKLDRPPIPLHKPHEKGYAESEISITPYPPKVGLESIVSTVVQNTSDTTMTVNLAFGWADFGAGIHFTSTGMTPSTRTVTLSPEMTATAAVSWLPVQSGHQCVQIELSDPDEIYEPQHSQRNVDVTDRPPCGHPQVFEFTVYNDSPFTATIDIGLITFNVPDDWEITVIPSDTLEIGPFGEGVVTVIVNIPCPTLFLAHAAQEIVMMQQASGSVPTIDVEAYNEGKLLGGVELQFTGEAEPPRYLYLPTILRDF